jgi:hypothetical protein
LKGAFLFQVRPDLFPEGMLGQVETQLWGMHYEQKQKKQKSKG